MKKLYLLSFFIFIFFAALAKDAIMLSDGQTIDCKVISIGKTDITYKRADNPDGPTYSVPVSKVFYITYENGQKEIINDLSKPSASATQTEQKSTGLKEQNMLAIEKEKEHIKQMGMNNIRIRFGIGVQCGSWSLGSRVPSTTYIGGGLPEFDVMWLHTVFDHTGNAGIGAGIYNMVGDVDDIGITATYFTVPLQLQYVAKSGLTFAGILTPAFLIDKSSELRNTEFANVRFGIGLELGYNYKRWCFGARGTMWIGNVIKGYSASLDYSLAVSIGYRIKLN